MCRFIAYIGKKALLADILVKPSNSLVKQSLLSKESSTITNGDGFGLGWYTPYSSEPAIFTSLFPAWNDQNLLHLAKKTMSPTFFGHVRAASTGGVTQYNCHPFFYKKWMFMHNGWIPSFQKIKRQLHELLDDELYNWMKGSTDSEVIFALFLQFAKQSKPESLLEIANTLFEVLKVIQKLVEKQAKRCICHFNICLTDGKRLIAFRYCTSKHSKPESMYMATDNGSIVVASEKLTRKKLSWHLIPANHALLIDANLEITRLSLSV